MVHVTAPPSTPTAIAATENRLLEEHEYTQARTTLSEPRASKALESGAQRILQRLPAQPPSTLLAVPFA
jgi:hypothetical protein